MTEHPINTGARLLISGTLEYRDKDGNVLGTTEMHGAIPLADTGLTAEEAQQIIDNPPTEE